MTQKDPYADSPYDASGMPLGAETVDYDVADDVAARTVKDKPVKHPKSINDIDYTPRAIDKKLTKESVKKENFNSAIKDNVNSGHPEGVKEIDFEEATIDDDDPKAVRKAVDEGDLSFLDKDKK